MIVLHICQLHIMPSILHIILNTSNTLMSGVELMIGAKSRKWVHQKQPTNQPTNYCNVQISKRIPDLCSVYTAELIALQLALNWIRDVKPSNSAIFYRFFNYLKSITEQKTV